MLLDDLSGSLLFLIPFGLEFFRKIFLVEELASFWIDLVMIKFIIIVTSVLLVTHMDLPSLEITVVLDGNVIHLVILVLVFFVNL